MLFGILFAVIVVLTLLWIIGLYNSLVRMRNQVKTSWSQIDVQLQRRHDLIPTLVDTVKGYMNYEKSTLEAVINARSRAVSAREQVEQEGGATETSLKSLLGAESLLQQALGNVLALAEGYPQLRASETMLKLQEELASTENKVAFARQAYNDQVLLYNTAQQKFPAMLLAKALGHHPADLFKVEELKVKEPISLQLNH